MIIILPYLDNLELTWQAIHDAALQSACARLVLYDNGSTPETIRAIEDRRPTIPADTYHLSGHGIISLGALWNTALRLAWSLGHDDALVINNDVRLRGDTYYLLRAAAERYNLGLCSAVNLPLDQLSQDLLPVAQWGPAPEALGGPDFSCFLIRRSFHRVFPFPEEYFPAYFEDNHYTRQVWLSGHGQALASVPVPFHHLGSQTIHRSAEAFEAFSPKFEANQQRYVQRWGGLPHAETHGLLMHLPGGWEPAPPTPAGWPGLRSPEEVIHGDAR